MTLNLFETIPYFLLGAWLLFSIYYLFRAARNPNKINPYIFESIPQVFPTIGILGTFMGIAYGLWHFNENDIEGSIPKLIQGLKTAFGASIFGVGLLIIFSKLTAIVQRKNDKGKLSDETIALNKLIEVVTEMKNNFNNSFISKDDNGNIVTPANVLKVLSEESRKQSGALQTFSTDLANTVSAGFEQILNNPNEGVVAELKLVKAEIENLGKKLQDPTTEMTKNVVDELTNAINKMVQDFQNTVTGNTNNELDQIAKILGQAGGSLTDFPAKLETMTNNLNENFRELQGVVQQIAKQTLSQSEESTGQMKRQIEEIAKALSENVGGLQRGQENLIAKQNENIQISDLLLTSFNTSIEKMNGLSIEVTETVSKFTKVQNELNIASVQLRTMTENMNSSTNTFKEAQQKFSQQSEQFIEGNNKTIVEIQNALSRASSVSDEYTKKFSVIEKGLQGIFKEIQEGIKNYSDVIADKNSKIIGQYTKAMNDATDSLAKAFQEHKERMEEVEEMVGQILKNKNS